MNADRTLPWDWHPGRVPDNVILHSEAYLETSYSFERFRSRRSEAIRIGRGASIYLGVMFDLGPSASVSIGEFSLLNGSRIICDASITIGAYCLVSWNTVLMDSRRVPHNARARRALLEAVGRSSERELGESELGTPIVLGNGVWLGFESCVLPGVEIGDGAIVGARSVVVESVPAYSIVAGNPARIVRQLDPRESQQAVAVAIASFNRALALQ
jgi:acetyltransferase-like isoleucine patch superfamily enzyme